MITLRKYELEQAEKSEHQLLLEHDIRKAIDRIHELETAQNNMAKERDNKDKTIRELSQTFATDKESLEKSNVSQTKLKITMLTPIYRITVHHVSS